MALPELWRESSSSPVVNSKIWQRTFECSGNKDVQINYCKRKKSLSPQAQTAFLKTLSMDPHLISQEEWFNLAAVVYPAGNSQAFQLDSAATLDVNGQRVLAFEGRWLESNLRAYHITFLANVYVHVVYFVAPSALYDQYIDAAQRSFSSIIWKDD